MNNASQRGSWMFVAPLRAAGVMLALAIIVEAVLATGAAQAQTYTAIPGPAQSVLQILNKHVRPAVTNKSATPVGFLPSTQRLNLVIHLPVRNQDELTSLMDRLSDPGSPDYHQWLSVAEFTERFGRTEVEYQKVLDFAKASGFAVTYQSPNRLMLVVRGSVTQIDKALHVTMQTYRHPTENRIFYSPDREPSFALDVPVSHISGLNNYSYPHPGGGPRPTEAGGRTYAGGPELTGTGSGPGGSFLGSDMRSAYNMGPTTGTGQTVGLAEFAGYAASDISLYFSNIHQGNNVPIDNIVVDGGSATTWSNANDEGEVCLDIEQAVSVAPGLTQLRVYIGPESFGSGVDGFIFSQMATDNVAKQLSNSWWWYPDDPATDDPYFEEMAAQGQTFFNISGDYGAYTGHSYNDMGYPAEDVHLTVVGGTALTTSGAGGPWQSEVVWNDFGDGSGGGPADDGATYFPIQGWQSPVINSSNGGSTTLRNSPDVALQADFDNYICYNRGTCATNWGGTSFATPRWAAWLALVNQQLVANGQAAGLGFINPTLYAIGQSSRYSSDFHDITVGNNDTNGQSTFYSAVIGYDLTTGWGSLNGQALMADLAPSGPQSFTLSATPTAVAIAKGGASSTSTITITPVNGFSSNVSLAASGLPKGVTAVFSPNPAFPTSVLTLTAAKTAKAGASTITIKGTSGSLSATTTLTLSVNALGSFTLTASPNTLTVAQGSNGTSTITVNPINGFDQEVTLGAIDLPSGITASFKTNPTISTSTLTLGVGGGAATGKSTITITGTYGSLIKKVKVKLTVTAP